MTEHGGRGPGIRGLMPGPGDDVLVDGSLVPGLRWLHWFRVALVYELADPPGALLLTGYLLPRLDRGETHRSHVLPVLVEEPADLIVERGGSRPGGTLPGAQLLRPAPAAPALPAAVVDALAHPDAFRRDLPTSTTPPLPQRRPRPCPTRHGPPPAPGRDWFNSTG